MTEDTNVTEKVIAEVEQVNEAVSVDSGEQQTMSNSQKKALKKYSKKVKKMMAAYNSETRRKNNMLKAQLKSIRDALGKESYAALKDIATVRIPEKKNEAGEVTQQASERINYRALLIEGRNLISVLRAERTKLGKRSAKSGRSSDRSRHNSLVRYLLKRNEEAKAEPVTKTVELNTDK